MTQQPYEVIWTLTNAVVVSSGIHVVAELGVADHIGADPVNVTELASRCGADAEALDRVLRLLATHGVFSDVGEAYEHTEPSRLLRSDHPQSMRAFAQMMALPLFTATTATCSIRCALVPRRWSRWRPRAVAVPAGPPVEPRRPTPSC